MATSAQHVMRWLDIEASNKVLEYPPFEDTDEALAWVSGRIHRALHGPDSEGAGMFQARAPDRVDNDYRLQSAWDLGWDFEDERG